MKGVVLCLCWLLALGEGRPQAAEVPQVVDIAAAYEQYHQLWLAEAQRNSVAPLAPHKRPTQTATATQEQPSKAPEPIAEVKMSPEPAAAEPEVKQIVAPEPVAPAAPDAEAAPDTLVADAATAYAEFHRLWLAEAARNAIAPTVGQQQPAATPAVQEEQPQMAVLQDQPAEQPQQAAPQEQAQQAAPLAPQEQAQQAVPLEQADVALEEPAPTPAEAAVDHEAEFARFHALWTQEAARNAIPPRVGAQPTQAQPETLQLVVEEAAPPAPLVASPAPSAVVPANPWAGGLNNVPIVILFPQSPSGAP